MHICIPDTREVRPQHGAAYVLYNIHIDGLYHCSLRYKQLLHLHQLLTKRFATTSPSYQLPQFPSKRLLPLSSGQLEDRRMQLEKYLQYISQDKLISSSLIFNLFLLEAQRESTRLKEKHVHLDIELVNGQKIRLPILTHDSADDILQACCRALGLPDRYHAYFCLCLCGYDVVRDKLIIKRRLSFNEAPFITLQMAIQQQEQLQSVLSPSPVSMIAQTTTATTTDQSNSALASDCHCLSCVQEQQVTTTGVPLISSSSAASDLLVNSNSRLSHYNHNNDKYNPCNAECQCNWQRDQQAVSQSNNGHYHTTNHRASSSSGRRSFVTHRILLRKSYWDPIYDTYVLNDNQALNLLFIQTVYDMKHSLMFVDRETYHRLETLLAQDMKLEYILLARTLKYYNYVHFEPCYSDYPRPRTKVMISIGSKELNMRVLKTPTSCQPSSSASPNFARTNTATATTARHSTDEPVLYCTSSLVPNGYPDLLTKEDIVEEEYNFKVPLIRCWRLTSLETLNSDSGNCSTRATTTAQTSSSRKNQRCGSAFASSPVTTTTLAGGKRKSLSLFNSIVGNSSPPSRAISNNGSGNCSRFIGSNHSQQQQQQQQYGNSMNGVDGTSLLATLTSINNDVSHDTNNNTATTNGPSFTTTSSVSTSQCDRSASLKNAKGNNLQQGASAYDTINNNDGHRPFLPTEQPMSQYELSFEYLISKDTLKWITISSDQAIFISISLQGVVDELVSKREGAFHVYQQQQLQVQEQQRRIQTEASSASQWPLYFNPSPPRPDQITTLIPPLYSSSDQPHIANKSRQSRSPKRLVESFSYMQRDGTQHQLSGLVRPSFGDNRAKNSVLISQQQAFVSNDGSNNGESERNRARVITPIPSFWSSTSQQHQNVTPNATNQGGSVFNASPSSSSASSFNSTTSANNSTSSILKKLSISSASSSNVGGHSCIAGQMEISRLSKKAPSPIINDAFEGLQVNGQGNGDEEAHLL